MAVVRVQTEDFDVGAEFAALMAARSGIGGVGCFVGVVRDDGAATGAGGGLAALTLEQYPAMTQRALERVAAEAERRWSLLGCTVIHRHGRLTAGANIVLVMSAAAHRQPALDATGFLIDWLKTSAPFWKKEEFADGTARWVESRKADDEAAARWLD